MSNKSERGDNSKQDDGLDVFRTFVEGLEAEGKITPSSQQEAIPVNIPQSEPIKPSIERGNDPNVRDVEVPGATFTLKQKAEGSCQYISINYDSVDQPRDFENIIKTLSQASKAAFPERDDMRVITATVEKDKKEQKFHLISAFDMEVFKLVLEDNSFYDSLSFKVDFQTDKRGEVHNKFGFSYTIKPGTKSSPPSESFRVTPWYASQVIGQDLSAFLLSRNREYKKFIGKDPEAHANLLTDKIREVAGEMRSYSSD